MVNVKSTNSENQRHDKSLNLLEAVRQFVTRVENHGDLEQLLQTELKRVDSEFDALEINQEHIYHYPKFDEVVRCFEKNLPNLTQMMYVIGKSGNDQEIDCITNYIKNRTDQVTKDFHEFDRDVVNLNLLPLVSLVTGYGLGLLSSQRLATFYKFFESTTGTQNFDSGTRIADYLLSHVWEGRDIRLWKYHLPEDSIEPSSSMSDAHNILITKMAFLDYFKDKLVNWLKSELDSAIDFGSLICNFKVLGSLVYMERFESEEIKGNLYNGGELDYTCFKFEQNSNFFDGEVNKIDKVLTKDNLKKLKKNGFIRGDSGHLKLFKQFYVELHYLPEFWCDANLKSEFFTE